MTKNVESKEKLRHDRCLKVVGELPYRNGSKFALSLTEYVFF